MKTISDFRRHAKILANVQVSREHVVHILSKLQSEKFFRKFMCVNTLHSHSQTVYGKNIVSYKMRRSLILDKHQITEVKDVPFAAL